MDINGLKHIAQLSKLSFTDEEAAKFCEDMSDIIALMDTIKDFDISYDDTKDNNEIAYADLREDESEPSFETDKLLSNTEPRDNCYVVPKMME